MSLEERIRSTLTAEAERLEPVPLPVSPVRRRRLRPLWIAAGSAAATLVVVGGVALLLGGTRGDVPGDSPTGPVPTTLETATSTAPVTTQPSQATTTPTTPLGSEPTGSLPPGAWTRWPMDPEVFDGSGVNDIVDTGDGVVAVGHVSGRCDDPDRGAAVWTSLDGIEWTRVELPGEIRAGGLMRAAAVGETGIVAVGDVVTGCDASNISQTAIAWQSQDGLNWTRSALPDGTIGWDVVATESGYIAVGEVSRIEGSDVFSDGGLWASEDGITWESLTDEDGTFLNSSLHSVVAGERGLVAVGTVPSEPDEDGDIWTDCCFAVWTSPTGSVWTLEYSDPNPVEPFTGRVWDLAAGSPGYVATGESNTWYSPDGENWEKTNPRLLGGRSATWAGDRWVLALDNQWAADGPAIWESTDGRGWTPVVAPDSGLFDPGHHTFVITVRPGGPGLIAWGWDYDSAPDDVTAWTWAQTTGGG